MGTDGMRLRHGLSALLLLAFAAVATLAFSSKAGAAWTPGLVVSEAANDGFNQSGDVNDAGDGIVVWQTNETTPQSIVARQIPAGGDISADPAQTVSDPSVSSTEPQVGMGDDGAVVTWLAENDYIQVARVPVGEEAEAPFDVTLPADGTAGTPNIAVQPDGDALIVFGFTPDGETDAQVYASFVPAGESPEPAMSLSSDPYTGFQAPFVDAKDAGFVVGWDGAANAEAVLVDDDGSAGGVLDAGPAGASLGGVAINPSGEAVVGLARFNLENEPPDASVQVARISPAGDVAEPVTIGTWALAAPPLVGIDAAGNIAAMFTSNATGIGMSFARVSADDQVGPVTSLAAPYSVGFGGDMGMDNHGNVYVYLVGQQLVDGETVFPSTARFIPAGQNESQFVQISSPGESSANEYGLGVAPDGGALVGFNDGELGVAASRYDTRAAASAESLDFGAVKVGESSSRSVTITNEGGSPLLVGDLTATGPFTAEPGTCAEEVAPGGSCEVTVRFNPTAAGAASGELAIGTDSIEPLAPIALAGTGQSTPTPPPTGTPKVSIAKVAPKKAKLKQGKSRVVRVTVRNTGDAAASGVKVCAKLSKSAKKKVRASGCKQLGELAAGATKTAKLKVTAKKGKRAKGKANVSLRLTSGNAGGGSGKTVITVKKPKKRK